MSIVAINEDLLQSNCFLFVFYFFIWQVKQSVIENNSRRTPFAQPSPFSHHKPTGHDYRPYAPSVPELHIEFKPLVQVDQSLLSSSRIPLQNPRPGDYMLNKTSSTEGIASKKSLELKKRYLLGEQTPIGSLMKSDSTSMLDSKFKNFHSSITTSSKFLNPSQPTHTGLVHSATTDMTPKPSLLTSQSAGLEFKPISTPPALAPDLPLVSHNNDRTPSDEKENVHKNANKNESQSKPVDLPEIVPMKLFETINSALVESKFQELVSSPKPTIETIDLVTPERPSPADTIQFTGSANEVRLNKKLIRSLSLSSPEIIDLTDEKTLLPSSPADSSPEKIAERSKNTIDSMLKNSELQRIAHTMENASDEPHRSKENILRPEKDHDADSLSSASDCSSNSNTSSIEDIPHFVLDSTTSPDTLPASDQFTPVGELITPPDSDMMQIDSLMIIDGKYIGDPDDLKHMRIPKGLDTQKERPLPFPIPKQNVALSPIVPKPQRAFKYESVLRKKPDLKFDTRNENKIETLKNMPIQMSIDPNVVLPCAKPLKPTVLPLKNTLLDPSADLVVDTDKTPTAPPPVDVRQGIETAGNSDSDTEVTGQLLTETELSDWAADDAVSENFLDIEFALNSNKGTIKRNHKKKKKHQQQQDAAKDGVGNAVVAVGTKDMDLEGIEFMDTGSEDSCMETFSATNQAMLRNRGYVQFVANNVVATDNGLRMPSANSVKLAQSNMNDSALYSYRSDAGYGSSPKESFDKNVDEEAPVAVAGVDYIEQGACVLGEWFLNIFFCIIIAVTI